MLINDELLGLIHGRNVSQNVFVFPALCNKLLAAQKKKKNNTKH